jgi:hypothetical protein
MPSVKFIPSFSGIGETSVLAAEIDAAIQHTAEQILETAHALAQDAGLTAYAASLHIETGARPKGRGYARVVADADEAAAREWGDSDNDRLRILGRAAGIQIFPDLGR